MRTRLKNISNWIICTIPVWSLVLIILLIAYKENHLTLYTTTVWFRGEKVNARIKKDSRISLQYGFGRDLFQREGQVMVRSGIPGSRGHLPIITTQIASSEEEKLYRKFFLTD